MRWAGLLAAVALVSQTGCVTTDSGSAAGGSPLAGSFSGSYVLGSGYTTNKGKRVPFTAKIAHAPGARNFSGVLTEPYSGFGNPVNGQLWSDVAGTVIMQADGKLRTKFSKVYRTVDQEALPYDAIFDPASGRWWGTWQFPSNPNHSGSFSARKQ